MIHTKNKADVLLGLQWGDEGKGKIVDVLTPGYNVIARFQGGPNAGHTLEFDNKKYVLHTIPSGIFHAGSVNLIGNGVVIDPMIFRKELNSIGLAMEVLHQRLLLSRKAHLILPSHKLMDAALEHSKGDLKIGSTLKGIGPTYTDKIARTGLRLGNMLQHDFSEQYDRLKESHLKKVIALGFDRQSVLLDGLSFEEYEKKWFEGVEVLKGFTFVDSEIFVNDSLEQNKKMLAEGAQGSLLDVDFGSYPFVTSSNTIAAGACTGLGLAPSAIGQVYGIFKAYCTRVGSGPFPTELFDVDGEKLREVGNEFGSTTGRPRRCGWLDLPALKYSVMINGVTSLIMTKADVLNGFEQFRVCIGYRYKGELIDYIPFEFEADQIEPVYQNFKGWNQSLEHVRSFDELPAALAQYIRFVENFTGVGVDIVSVGPDRSQTLIKK
ncbi:MAG: adenylosuccinate synthase [Bacteroidales bacterium]